MHWHPWRHPCSVPQARTRAAVVVWAVDREHPLAPMSIKLVPLLHAAHARLLDCQCVLL
jgi:hypothetical protein